MRPPAVATPAVPPIAGAPADLYRPSLSGQYVQMARVTSEQRLLLQQTLQVAEALGRTFAP